MFVHYLSDILAGTYKVPAPIDPDRSFQQLEVDSLSLAELGAQLEDEFGITIEEEELTPATTVTALAEFLQARGAVLTA
ncbi:acyl carrier protein [Streptomyces paradoxus]|uniref:Acyl carrier protein n=1 Tax=Streptomyces paradoxus TaxID=66375 RepID=A0A7W9T6T9_9ACTN|nr:acyl carrier protein [Streptomyces paradoxus]MBB6075114.1 acyl carrier protein [Streptomyces paradoxus]